MNASLGPVGQEIVARLQAALNPQHFAISNDSAKHSGHMGDDQSGESHFSVDIVAEVFVGKTRLARQRMVNDALADLLREKVHALAIRTRAPGE